MSVAGSCLIYVDDIMGCCPTTALDTTLTTVRAIVTTLLGPDSVEAKKTASGRRLDFLG
jgi:hypothetical protein